jgi:hypothetical protein
MTPTPAQTGWLTVVETLTLVIMGVVQSLRSRKVKELVWIPNRNLNRLIKKNILHELGYRPFSRATWLRKLAALLNHRLEC